MTSLMRLKNYVIIASLKSETRDKLINRMPGLRLLISSVPGLALGTLALPGKLDIKRHSPSILYISCIMCLSCCSLML